MVFVLALFDTLVEKNPMRPFHAEGKKVLNVKYSNNARTL
jgi:uncharacterized protein YkuJ